MLIHDTIVDVRRVLRDQRREGRVVGFVPTMGALHAGHLSLVDAARRECDFVVMSIFVNPLQFDRADDLARYPTPFDADRRLAEAAGVDCLFVPSAAEMYPGGRPLTTIAVAEVSESFEGADRPGHFTGVATVVAKLFNIVGECRAYFGEKDWQQLAVVRRMIDDLSFPVTLVPCRTIREDDGLALSSRNVHLDPHQRRAALSLPRALDAGRRHFATGSDDVDEIEAAMLRELVDEEGAQPHYAVVVDSGLARARKVSPDDRLLVAATVGSTRLIDNASLVDPPGGCEEGVS